jgi:hypothetical protein
MLITGDMGKATIRELKNKYNSPQNADGKHVKVLIASQIMREGHDLKCVNNLFILTLPINIPLLLQVIGRTVRKNSHRDLPQDRRYVDVFILTSSMPIPNRNNVLSPEEQNYKDKLDDYKTIQQIEKIMNENAVDAFIHKETNFPSSKEVIKEPALGNLYFEPNIPKELTKRAEKFELKDLNVLTFNVYGYSQSEVDMLIQVIKQLFYLESIWTYKDLWESARSPPFGLEMNPKLFSENNFMFALHKLTTIDDESVVRDEVVDKLKLFDSTTKFIPKGNTFYRIRQVGAYFVLVPFLSRPIIDYESYLREPQANNQSRVSVEKYLNNTKLDKFRKLLDEYLKNLPEKNLFSNLHKVFSIKNAEFYYLAAKEHIDGNYLSEDLVEIFSNLGIFLYYDQISTSGIKVRKTNRPVGYAKLTTDEIKSSDGWVSMPKAQKSSSWVENNIIGYFDETLQFKLRKPSHKGIKDGRLQEKGIVCETQSKGQLIKYSRRLKIDPHNRIKKICNQLMNELLQQEMHSRSGKRSQKIKWVYMFNEYPPI